MSYALSVLVENQSGVLTKVAGLFARHGYNIQSLTGRRGSGPQPILHDHHY